MAALYWESLSEPGHWNWDLREIGSQKPGKRSSTLKKQQKKNKQHFMKWRTGICLTREAGNKWGRGKVAGKGQIIEDVVNHGEEFGFYSELVTFVFKCRLAKSILPLSLISLSWFPVFINLVLHLRSHVILFFITQDDKPWHDSLQHCHLNFEWNLSFSEWTLQFYIFKTTIIALVPTCGRSH